MNILKYHMCLYIGEGAYYYAKKKRSLKRAAEHLTTSLITCIMFGKQSKPEFFSSKHIFTHLSSLQK